jgi:hypothetical protein
VAGRLEHALPVADGAMISPGGFGTDGRDSAQFTYVIPLSASGGFHTVTADGKQTDLSDGFTVADGAACHSRMLAGGGGNRPATTARAATATRARTTHRRSRGAR